MTKRISLTRYLVEQQRVDGHIPGDLRLLLLTGFCGAFTTFSGFAWEADRLWPVARTSFWWAVAVMPTACVAAFLLAWRIAGAAAS